MGELSGGDVGFQGANRLFAHNPRAMNWRIAETGGDVKVQLALSSQ
jgi:hypothetical protein